MCSRSPASSREPADKPTPRTAAEKADWMTRHEAIAARAKKGRRELCFERAGISGISQGGFVSFLAITMDSRFKAATPIIGSPDLEARFGSSLPLAEHAPEVIDLVVRTSPLRNCHRMPPVALLVQSGAKDEAVPIAGLRKLDEQLKPLYREMPERYRYIEYPELGHSDQGMREPSIEWLAKHLGLPEEVHA